MRRSKKRRPVVPIDPKVRPVVERLLIENAGGVYLFGNKWDMYKRFKAHMIAIGYTEKSNPHILRHSRATHLLQDGVPIYDVARLLGDTVATVERVYGHHSADYLAAAIDVAGIRGG
jgi:integrase